MTVPEQEFYPYRGLGVMWAFSALCLLASFVLGGSWWCLVLGLAMAREAGWCLTKKGWLW